MNSGQTEIQKRIERFFSYVGGILDTCESILNDHQNSDWGARKRIVLNTLFALLSLLATCYCAGETRKKGRPKSGIEFISFVNAFWDQAKEKRLYSIEFIKNNKTVERKCLSSSQLLWEARNFLAHQFEQTGITFDDKTDARVIFADPGDAIEYKGSDHVEVGVNVWGLLRMVRDVSKKYKQYCLERCIYPPSNVLTHELRAV